MQSNPQGDRTVPKPARQGDLWREQKELGKGRHQGRWQSYSLPKYISPGGVMGHGHIGSEATECLKTITCWLVFHFHQSFLWSWTFDSKMKYMFLRLIIICLLVSDHFLLLKKRVGTLVYIEFISLNSSMLLKMIKSGRLRVKSFYGCRGAGWILDPDFEIHLRVPVAFPGHTFPFKIPIEWIFLQIASLFKIPRWISTAYNSS